MSKYLIFISLWVLIVAQMNAQSSCWKIAQEYTCSEFVFDIKFTDAQHGWVLGNSGYILHTDDGGSSWSQQTSNITSAILRGYFFNNSLGFTSGANYICKTTDGGQTWTPTYLGNVWLLDIFFINTSTGWAAGRTYGGNGIVFRTIDGGATWQSISFPSTMPALGGVFFLNSNTGWIVGSGGNIYKTTDGGSNWVLQPSPTTNQLNNVFFLNTQLGWISAGTMMLKTQNGGTTWDSISPILNVQYWPTLANQPIRFFDADNGVCMDHITNDGGFSWHRPCGDFSYSGSGDNNTWAVSFFTSMNNGWVKSSEFSNNGGSAQISNLVNTPQPPPTPEIFFPKSNAYDIQSDTRIAWEADIHCSVDSFHISVGTSPGGQDVVAKFSVPVSHESRRYEGNNGWVVPCNQNYIYHVPIRNLPDGTKLYASVSASNAIGESSPHIVSFTTIEYQEDCNLQEDIRWDTLISGIDTMLRVTTPRLPVSNSGIIYNQPFENGFAFDTSHYIKTDDRFGRKERALKMSVGGWTYLPYQHNPVDFTVSLWMKDAYNIGNGNSALSSSCWSQYFAYPPLFAPLQFHLRNHYISKKCEGYPNGSPIEIEYGAYPPSNWNHFVLTFKDSTATAYMNGVIANQKILEDKTKGLLNGNFYKNVNWLWSGGTSNGIIYDDFLLFHRALDSNEVRQLYEFKPPLLKIDTTICAGQSFDFLGNHYDTTGCYQITLPYEYARGCDSTIIVNLTVEPLPTPATGPDFTHCPQSPLYLPGSGAGTPFWSGPNGFTANTLNPVVNNPVSGVYRLTLTNSAGCSASDTVNITIGFPNHAEIAPPSHEISCAQPTLTLEPINLFLGTCSTLEWTAFNGGHFVGNPSQGIVDHSGLYRLIVTDPCGGCPDTAFVTVASAALTPPGAVAVGATLDCVHQSVVIEGSSPTQNVNYSWSGPNGFSANSAVANVAIPGLYTLTITDPSGCSSTATAIVVQDLSLPDVTATGAVINCTNTHVQVLGESETLGATFSWIGPDAFSAITPLIDVSVPGIYTLTVTGFNGCTATTTVTVSQDLSLPSIAVSPVKICQGQSALLTATVSNFLQINWFDSTGGTLLGTDATLSVLPAGSGTVNYVVVATAPSGCTASATAIVEVGAPLNVQVSGPDTVCVGEYTVLTASGAESYLWPNGATTSTLNFYPSQGQNSVQLEASNSFGCSQVINNIVYGKPVLDISIQGGNPLCVGMRDTLIASGNNVNTFLWAPGGGTFNSLVIEPLVTTTYYVTSNKNGFCQGKDSVKVEVRSLSEANAGVDVQVCMGTATIMGNLPPGGAGIWTALDGGAVTDKNSAQTQAIDLESGINRFEWKISVIPCMGVRTDTVAVFLADQIPVAYADDTLLTEVQPIELSLLSNDMLPAGFPGFDIKLTEKDDMGTWILSPDGMLRFEPGSNFSGIANAAYEICNKICPEICDAAAVRLFLHRPEDDLGKTQVITPNGDTKNDVLIFDYLDQYPDNSIVVFNRWGQRVYDSKPYPNNEKDGWKGDWHGKPLPAGTYYFILNLTGEDELVWGNILIVR